MYAPPQTPCPSGQSDGFGFFFTDPSCTAGNPNDIFYDSFDYTDPLEQLNISSPVVYSGSVEDRTIKFCATYDNGESNPDEVKRRSTSPPPPNPFIPGGPCSLSEVKCMGGPNVGQPCSGLDINCPGSFCDACDVKGGVRTEDEMFILMGYFYVP